MSDQHVSEELRNWLAIGAPQVALADVIDSVRARLAAGRTLAAIIGPHCSALHVDTGMLATCKHSWLCQTANCGEGCQTPNLGFFSLHFPYFDHGTTILLELAICVWHDVGIRIMVYHHTGPGGWSI